MKLVANGDSDRVLKLVKKKTTELFVALFSPTNYEEIRATDPIMASGRRRDAGRRGREASAGAEERRIRRGCGPCILGLAGALT